jgi:hypothetical protein
MPEIISGFKVGGEGLDAAPFGKIRGASEWQTDQAERNNDGNMNPPRYYLVAKHSGYRD